MAMRALDSPATRPVSMVPSPSPTGTKLLHRIIALLRRGPSPAMVVISVGAPTTTST
jgi:hypothetical protein